ncbi:MAG: hypothetical protein ABSC29_00250 [Minisyncoccia bacterium]|jgi:hypothetical protein
MKFSHHKGQSLLEVMIALTMLTTGLLGIASLLGQSFFLGRVIADEAVATYLASEGIEIAKNLIDHDVYAHLAVPPAGLGWGSCFGTAAANTGGNDFQLDYTTTDCAEIASYDGTRHLNLDPNTHLYSYQVTAGAVATVFTRDVRVAVPNANEIVVSSIVRWSTGPLASQSINLEDRFYNWHP